MKIDKLKYYSTSPNGYYWIEHPNKDDVINKINEIIDYINRGIKDDEPRGEA